MQVHAVRLGALHTTQEVGAVLGGAKRHSVRGGLGEGGGVEGGGSGGGRSGGEGE